MSNRGSPVVNNSDCSLFHHCLHDLSSYTILNHVHMFTIGVTIEEMFQDFIAGRACFPVFRKRSKTSANPDFCDAFVEKTRQISLKFFHAENCGQLCFTG